MRHGRAKAARKTLQYFSRTIGLKAPYSILMDPTFVAALFQQKILPAIPRMDRILQTTGAAGANRYCVTQTAVEELQVIYQGLLAKKHDKADAFVEALDFIRNECIVLRRREIKSETKPNKGELDGENKGEAVDADEHTYTPQEDLFYHLEEDERPYVIATQDEGLLSNLRNRGTVPIMRLANNSVLLLEQPSKQSQMQAKGAERHKWKHDLLTAEKALVNLVKKEKRGSRMSFGESGPPPPQHRQRAKKAKGPNPLSCKRKQKSEDENKESASKKRRNRGSNKNQKVETDS